MLYSVLNLPNIYNRAVFDKEKRLLFYTTTEGFLPKYVGNISLINLLIQRLINTVNVS